VSTDMIMERGYQSALSACPEPGAAFAALMPAEARLRGAGVDVRRQLDAAAAPTQGTGLPIADAVRGARPSVAGRIVADVHAMTLVQFVQPHPGDRARRPPA
jgi:hypothetical protein